MIKCSYCKEEAQYFYFLEPGKGAKACIKCWHGFRGNAAFIQMGAKLSADQRRRTKLFKK